ncbi:GNAT family N-acetyltransferase, partial [Klebsiella pneumoniae]|nr:GNAT family N-acetyltransferase [Klebsiella pneumoniae]
VGSEIAATSYLGGKRLVLRGVTMGAYEIGETATRPAHQRRGLFSQLVNASRAYAIASGRPLIYGTPNGQSTPGYAKLGFDIVQS